MRRVFALILALGLVLSLAACGNPAGDGETVQESTMRMEGPFDLEGYLEMLRAFTMHPGDYARRRGTCDGLRLEIAVEIEAVFGPLKDYQMRDLDDTLPDEAILGFMQWFMSVCHSLGSDTAYENPEVYPYTQYELGENGGIEYLPNYAFILWEVLCKPSPGMANWLNLKNEAADWGTEFDMRAFAREYPALAEKIQNTKYTLLLDGKEQEFTI